MRGLLIDLDGTLYVGDTPLPGAVEAIQWLAGRNVPRRYLTNTTRVSRGQLTERLKKMGFPIDEEEIFTAPRAAADWLRSRSTRRISLLLPEAAEEDFAGFELVRHDPEMVVAGDLGREWSYDRLNVAFRQLMEGAELVALHRNRYWTTPEGISLDAGPFVAALEYAAGKRATVVGKPSAPFFQLAATSLGLDGDRITVIGDDLDADIAGAQAAGMRGILVRTGKFREEVLQQSRITPDAICADVAEAVRTLTAG